MPEANEPQEHPDLPVLDRSKIPPHGELPDMSAGTYRERVGTVLDTYL